jgi:hypothetical protein
LPSILLYGGGGNKNKKINHISYTSNRIYNISIHIYIDINIVCDNNSITPVTDIKFLGIYLQDSINWSCHIEYIIPKLSSACYVMRSVKPIMPINTLKTVYFSHFNAIIPYGLPFWGNSPHSTKIFKMQKRIVRIMMGYRNRVSCRSLFKGLEILPLTSQYILSLMLFCS